MSRIEEATRRAASLSSGHPAGDDATGLLPSQVTSLSRFPVESPGPTGPTRRDVSAARSPRVLDPSTAGTGGGFPSALDGKLILNRAAPVAVEQYRRLAATLHDLQSSHGTKTLMVSSALPREGKTLTVTNLALTLSEAYGRRVLLIDADLRRPTVHEIFRLSNARGLSEGLRSDREDLSLLPVTPLLSVLPAGQPSSNPMAGLTSERMRVLLEEAASVFDWVLLDAPPVGIMPDAHLLARLTEGVIFVIAAGSTPYLSSPAPSPTLARRTSSALF